MPFSMSGSNPLGYSYNRFDKFEAEYNKKEEETLEEGSCNTKGYQEGGEVKCDECDGKGCDHCDDKGTHKKGKEKEEVKEGAKPDFLDLDKDGNKKEAMKKAASEKADAHRMKTFQKLQKNVDEKSKKEVKEENLEENRMAAHDPEGYARKVAAEKDAAKPSKVRNSVSDKGREYAVTGTPERSKASERRKDRRTLAGYGEGGKEMAIDRAKKERDANREARRLKKEELEATGIFTVEEIEALLGKF